MSILECFWTVTKMATPLVLGMLLFLLVQLTNTYFIGNLNEPVLLAGVGMGNMMVNMLVFAVTEGLNGALESLISQAYGAKKYEACGIFLNRGKFVCTLLFVPITCIFYFSDKILIGLHQDAQISHVSRLYCCQILPGIWAMAMFDATRRFLSAQLVTTVSLYVQLATLTLHVFCCWLFISRLHWGASGAALATNFTYILNFVIQEAVCYSRKSLEPTYQVLPDRRSLQNIGFYLKIAVPGACMLCFEWWCFELLAIFSGLMSVQALAAEVVIVNVVAFIFMVPLGIGFAASAFAGVFLGRGKISQAKKFSRLTLAFNVVVTVCILVVFHVCKRQITHFFTQDRQTVAIIDDVWGILVLYIFFDTIHGVQAGIIRGLGLQVVGSIYTLVCYYLIGLPFALWLAFERQMGVQGLWLGFGIACIILDAGFACIIECPNWSRIAQEM